VSLSSGERGEVYHVDFLIGEITAEEVASLELEAVGKSLQGLFKHELVVESQLWQLVDREPSCHPGIIATLDILDVGQGEKGDGDDTLARVAVGRCKGSELVNIGHLQARLLEEFASSPVGGILIDIEEATWESPVAHEGLAAALDEQDIEV